MSSWRFTEKRTRNGLSSLVIGGGIFAVLLLGTVVVSISGWLDTWYGQVIALLVSLVLAAAGSWLYARWRDSEPGDRRRRIA